MKRNLKKNLLIISAVIVALMVIIAFVPGVQKVVPEAVANFAVQWNSVFVGAFVVLLAALLWPVSWIVGLCLVVIGAIIIWTSLPKKVE